MCGFYFYQDTRYKILFVFSCVQLHMYKTYNTQYLQQKWKTRLYMMSQNFMKEEICLATFISSTIFINRTKLYMLWFRFSWKYNGTNLLLRLTISVLSHLKKIWYSSPSTIELHFWQCLICLSTFPYRPVSIGSLWLLHLNFTINLQVDLGTLYR